MKTFFEKLLECLVALLPFLRKKNGMKEFNELITGQYSFLTEQLEKALADYFELSHRVKQMHEEMLALRRELAEALSLRCRVKECDRREVTDTCAPST